MSVISLLTPDVLGLPRRFLTPRSPISLSIKTGYLSRLDPEREMLAPRELVSRPINSMAFVAIASVAVRRLPMRVNLSGRGTLTGRARCLSDVACGLTAICCCARRSWIPARREAVLEANGVFSRLIGEGSGLREQSGGCRTRTRSLPSPVRQPPDRYRLAHASLR